MSNKNTNEGTYTMTSNGTAIYYVSTANKDGAYISYQTVPLGEKGYQPMNGEKLFTHSFLMDTLRKLMGRTLTVIDASVHEHQQNKAMKDLLRSIFSDEMEFAAEWGFDQEEIQKFIPEDIDPKELGEVSIEEALGVDEKKD